MMTSILATITVADTTADIIRLIENNFLWITGITIVFICVGFTTVSGIIRTRARERTRREIAAYIAEGSMTPEQGERLMRAGSSATSDA